MVPFNPNGPARSESVFNARANEQPAFGVAGRKEGAVRCHRYAVMHPAAASLAIEQPVVYRPTEACRQRSDPIDFCAGCQDRRIVVRPDVRSIEHPFDADNKLGPKLPVVANLSAADKSGVVVVEGYTEPIIEQCAALPRASQIAADIKPGPVIERNRRHNWRCGGPSYRQWPSYRHVGSECARRSHRQKCRDA